MNENQLRKLFQQHDDEYLNFEKVQNKRSRRADIHAFLLLDELLPPEEGECGTQNLISCAEHDEFWLEVDLDKLLKVVTKDQVLELVRCGVLIDEHGLKMNA